METDSGYASKYKTSVPKMSSSKHSASSELKHNKYLDAVQLERKMKKKKRKKEERKGVADEYDDGFRGR